MKYISWFSGIGGFDLALNRSGMTCVGACEINPFARRVYEARFGNPWFPADISTVAADEIPDADLWCGGSPCVGFSIAGLRGGLEDPRSGLLRSWMDLVAARKPRFLLFENVPGIFSVNDGRDWGEFLARLDEIGYSGAWRVLNAQYFGVPQRRRRVFLIAEREDSKAGIALFEDGEPLSESLFRKGYIWDGGQTSFFGGGEPSRPMWGSAGKWAAGRCSTTAWSEAPEKPAPSSLAALLEHKEVPSRFFLSPRAAAGIVRRAARRGRKLPATLLTALGGRETLDILESTSASLPIDRQETMGALLRGYGNGSELHPDRMGRDCNQLVLGRLPASPANQKEVDNAPIGALTSLPVGTGWRVCADAAAAGHLIPVAPFVQQAMSAKWAKGTSGPSGDEYHNLVPMAEVISFDLAQITSPENRTRPEPGQPAPSLAATNSIHVAAVTGVASTLRAADGHHGRSSPRGDGSDNLVAVRSSVRRMTPLECERLQGLPDGHTCVCGVTPYSTAYSTAACTCPDSGRYRVCGNSVAVPVVEWIARRLAHALIE